MNIPTPPEPSLTCLSLIHDEGQNFIIVAQYLHDDDPNQHMDEPIYEGPYHDAMVKFQEFAANGWNQFDHLSNGHSMSYLNQYLAESLNVILALVRNEAPGQNFRAIYQIKNSGQNEASIENHTGFSYQLAASLIEPINATQLVGILRQDGKEDMNRRCRSSNLLEHAQNIVGFVEKVTGKG